MHLNKFIYSGRCTNVFRSIFLLKDHSDYFNMHNTDGSLDINVQHDNPGKDKESNWLPAPTGEFSLN